MKAIPATSVGDVIDMLNTLKGAIAVIIIEVAFYLVPPDHDPAFSALRPSLQLFTIIALSAAMLGGIILFMAGIFIELDQKFRKDSQAGDANNEGPEPK